MDDELYEEENSLPPSQEQVQNQAPLTAPAYDLRKKEKELEFKRIRFVIFSKGLLILLVVFGGIASAGYYAYRKLYVERPQYKSVEVPPEDSKPKDPAETNIVNDKRIDYKSDLFRLSLRYPERAKLIEKEIEGSNPQKLEITYDEYLSKDNAEVNETNLKRGFIFKITLLDLPNRKLDSVTNTKNTYYIEKCPEVAQVTKPYGTKVDNVDSMAFKVGNCGPSYVVTYVPRFNIFFEIEQVYSGDLGFQERYKSVTDEILASIDFYLSDEEMPLNEPFKTVINDKLKFRFKYPSDMDDSCCDIPPPIQGEQFVKYSVLVDKTPSGNNTFGVFTRNKNNYSESGKLTYDKYIEREKALLIADYKVATGSTPVVSEEQITIGGKSAVLLKGYSWRGHEIIFLKISEENALIFVTDNKTGDDFKLKIEGILNSFEFF